MPAPLGRCTSTPPHGSAAGSDPASRVTTATTSTRSTVPRPTATRWSEVVGTGCQAAASPDEPLGVLASQAQRPRGDEQLLVGQVGGGGAAVEPGQPGGAVAEVDLAPVVRVDEAEVERLVALVDVGHPRQHELEQLLTERRRAGPRPRSAPPTPRRGPRAGHRPGPRRRTVDRGLVLLVGVGPPRVGLVLADRLARVGEQPLLADRPRPDEGLPQAGTRSPSSGSPRSGRASSCASRSQSRHCAGCSEMASSRARTSSEALGVVGRQGRHRRRPPRGRPLDEGEQLRGETRSAPGRPDLVEGDEPVVAVERRVLDPLGHDRAAGLLEAHDDVGHRLLVGAGGRPSGQDLGDRSRVAWSASSRCSRAGRRSR